MTGGGVGRDLNQTRIKKKKQIELDLKELK